MDDLPLELIVHILQYLNKHEQIRFSIVNKKFHEAVLSPSLWTENEKCLEVPTNRMKSFRKFLKHVPKLRCLNLVFGSINFGIINSMRLGLRPIDINLQTVLKPLQNLEFLSLQLIECKSRVTYFPSSIKHIILRDYFRERDSCFVNGDLLKSLADSCPQLEYIEIDSETHEPFSHVALCYLLDKVKDTLKTLILSDYFIDKPAFYFIDCPPNVTTLCYNTSFLKRHDDGPGKLIDLPNFEILQILALDQKFPLSNEDFNEKLSIPSLQILYLNACFADFDVVLKFVKCCPSLKVLAWREPNGYSNKALSELDKLCKEKSVKVYLNFKADPTSICDEPVQNFPPFPNENFLFCDTFSQDFFHKHHFISNFFKGRGIGPH